MMRIIIIIIIILYHHILKLLGNKLYKKKYLDDR